MRAGWAAAGLLTLLALGCQSSGASDDDDLEMFTAQAALDRVEQHLQSAVEQIDPRPELADLEVDSPVPCQVGEGSTVERRYHLDGIPVDENGDVLDAIHGHWSSDGYSVTTDRRQGSRTRWVQARHEDGFTMSLREDIEGYLTLSASSLCVLLTDG